jgi:hypothetical protein
VGIGLALAAFVVVMLVVKNEIIKNPQEAMMGAAEAVDQSPAPGL